MYFFAHTIFFFLHSKIKKELPKFQELSLTLDLSLSTLVFIHYYINQPLAAKSKSNILIADSLMTEPGPKIAAAPASYKY